MIHPIPMPGDTLGNSTVIASTYLGQVDNDETELPDAYGLLLLNKQAPFYTVAITQPVDGPTLTFQYANNHGNVIPAAEEYQDVTGCW